MAKLDYSKIFIKDACPTSIGGQAVMEGVMMQGPDRIALAMRLPSGELYLRTKRKPKESKAMKLPVVRGVIAFVKSLTLGMSTLMESADILEQYAPAEYGEEPGKFEKWMTDKFGQKATWNFLMTMSVILAMLITVVVFVIFPTWAVNLLGKWVKSAVLLNLIEGLLRIGLFVLYVLAIRKMSDIYTLFQYHGAEHKSIHCFENNRELTPAEAAEYPTLHPRCGTSFLVFVLIISLLLFSFLGWPNLLYRILSRLLLIPVIAGLSYELLKWAGRSDNKIVRILSYPGLMLQKLTTAEPTEAQLEVGLLSLKAVLAPKGTPMVQGFVDADGNLINEFEEQDFIERKTIMDINKEAEKKALLGDILPVPEFDYSAKETQSEQNLENLLRWGEAQLADVDNGRNEAMMILNYATGNSRSDVIAHPKKEISREDCLEYARRIGQRKKGEPFQYIVGTQMFMGLPFRVNRSVLIPRMDTEVLVEQALDIIKNQVWDDPEVLDMCTGSGAIGVSIAAKVPHAMVTMTDISVDALAVASSNAELNSVDRRCKVCLGDLWSALPSGASFNMILSNPPYIETETIKTLAREVKDYEPITALDGGEDGLDYYRRIASEAHKYLRSGGVMLLEIGAEQGAAVRDMLKATGKYEAIRIVKDLAGLDRVVVAYSRKDL